MTRHHVTRFAPSPTGPLHLGHIVSALHARDMAGPGGRFLVRNENIDHTRCTPAFSEMLTEDLAWLGFLPTTPMRVQSDHQPDYLHVLETLRSRHLLYPCFCTRKAVAETSTGTAPDGSAIYGGTCRMHPLTSTDQPPVWRLDMARALDLLHGAPSWIEAGRGRMKGNAAAFGDIVLARRDTGLSYHLCVTHDDALQGISCVTRGDDLFAATSVHRVLQALMGWPEPLYAHHALILGQDGRKLSKRDGAEGVRTLREAGWSPQDVLAHPRVQTCLAETSRRLAIPAGKAAGK